MARPKTKGPTIGIQLPLVLDATVRARAAQSGMSPGLFLTGLLARPDVAEGLLRANRRDVRRTATRHRSPFDRSPA